MDPIIPNTPTTVGQAAATAPNGAAANKKTIIDNASGCPTGSTGAQQRDGPPTALPQAAPAAYAKADPARLVNLPDVIKQHAPCCVWRAVPRPGSDKPAKVPYDPKTGQPAKPGDLGTFGSYAEAMAALSTGNYTGIGIAVVGQLAAVDIDGCVDAAGNLSKMAQDIIATLDGYTEYSPSGTGIRVLVLVREGYSVPKDKYYISNPSLHLEIYVSGVTAKYVTVTGNTLAPGADLVERTGELTMVLDKYMVRHQPLASIADPVPVQASGPPADPAAIQATDRQLLDEIAQTSSGPRLAALLAGDMAECGGDRSSADMTVCNILAAHTTDAAQIDRIIRGSKLMRDKWDRPTNGSTYGAITIGKAIASAVQYRRAHGELTPEQVRSVFVQAAPQQLLPGQSAASQSPQTATATANPGSTLLLRYGAPISAADLEKKAFPPLNYWIDGLLTEGMTILASMPKIGKSWMVLSMLIAIATGTPYWGRPTTQAECMYLALEDDQRRLQYRMRKLLQGRPFPPDLYLMTAAPDTVSGLYLLLDQCLALHPDIKVVAIDTLAKVRKQQSSSKGIYQADYSELGTLRQYFVDRGITVFLVHHLSKREDDGDPIARMSGSTGLTGVADSLWTLVKEKRYEGEARIIFSPWFCWSCRLHRKKIASKFSDACNLLAGTVLNRVRTLYWVQKKGTDLVP